MVYRTAFALLILGNLARPMAAQDIEYSAASIRASGGTLPSQAGCNRFVIPVGVLESGVSGILRVVYAVGADGQVSPDEIIVVESPHPGVTRAVQAHLLDCRFTPGRLGPDGPAVRVVTRMDLRFGTGVTRPGASPPSDSQETRNQGPPIPGPDLGGIFSLDDPDTIVTERPRRIHCPYYDPMARATRSRVGDRYRKRLDLDRLPPKVEAVLELVIGTDGTPVRRMSRVVRTSDPRLDAPPLDPPLTAGQAEPRELAQVERTDDRHERDARDLRRLLCRQVMRVQVAEHRVDEVLIASLRLLVDRHEPVVVLRSVGLQVVTEIKEWLLKYVPLAQE